jgi:hypothetical protein
MAAEILAKRYELQYVLYLLALHRLLKLRLPDYDYDRHMGGALYLFLRGSQAPSRGIHAERPPRALIEALDHLFARRRPGGRMNPVLPTPPRPSLLDRWAATAGCAPWTPPSPPSSRARRPTRRRC